MSDRVWVTPNGVEVPIPADMIAALDAINRVMPGCVATHYRRRADDSWISTGRDVDRGVVRGQRR